MEFRCPHCDYTAFRMVPGAVQAAACLSCGESLHGPMRATHRERASRTHRLCEMQSAEEFHGPCGAIEVGAPRNLGTRANKQSSGARAGAASRRGAESISYARLARTRQARGTNNGETGSC
jgi:hypothetical protein